MWSEKKLYKHEMISALENKRGHVNKYCTALHVTGSQSSKHRSNVLVQKSKGTIPLGLRIGGMTGCPAESVGKTTTLKSITSERKIKNKANIKKAGQIVSSSNLGNEIIYDPSYDLCSNWILNIKSRGGGLRDE